MSDRKLANRMNTSGLGLGLWSGLGSCLGLGLWSGLGLGSSLPNYTYLQMFPNDSPFSVYNCSYFVLWIHNPSNGRSMPWKKWGGGGGGAQSNFPTLDHQVGYLKIPIYISCFENIGSIGPLGPYASCSQLWCGFSAQHILELLINYFYLRL